MAQAWLTQRFRDLVPSDFGMDCIHFYSTADLKPPEAFQSMWTNFGLDSVLEAMPSAAQMEKLEAIAIFCNPFVHSQIDALMTFVSEMDSLGHDVPLMCFVTHTCAPEPRPEGRSEEESANLPRDTVIRNLLEIGLDGIIVGEPESFGLALALRTKISKAAALSRTLSDMVAERRARAQYYSFLQECVQCILWDYLRIRLARSIPPIDYDLPRGELKQVGGYVFGCALGSGTYGTVYKVTIMSQDGKSERCEVMKVMDTSTVKELSDLRCLKRMIDGMQLLSEEGGMHPNIVQFYQTYHSPSSMYFRMEYGGPENLFRRLSHRDKMGEKHRPLSLKHTASLLAQALDVIAHLHVKVHMCHRDIKPENFIVDEDGDKIVLKLADFDLALVKTDGTMCRNTCGTIPFTAPEAILEPEYCGMAADIWSLGIVFLEIHCGVRIVEHTLHLHDNTLVKARSANHPDSSVPKKIKAGFKGQGAVKMLHENCRQDLEPLLKATLPLLGGMLNVTVSERWQASDCVPSIDELPCH